jgi:Ser/Thr protein kinase RdoA (MazF antagonist)
MSRTMDDAGGGVRGLRAIPSPHLLDAACAAFGIDCGGEHVDLGGSSALNLLVGAGDDRRVLKVHRPYVTAERLRDIHLARRELSAAGVPFPETMRSLNGDAWFVFRDRLVEAQLYVEHETTMDSWERLQEGLAMLGRIHSILRGVRVGIEGSDPLFANHIEPSDALDRTLLGTQRIRSWGPTTAELELAASAEGLARAVARDERRFVPELPRQLVHGDSRNENVCFRGGRLVLVTDLDFMGERARIDDLALTLYFACLEFGVDPSSENELRRLRTLVDAYDSALTPPLTSVERAALPLAIARQPLWSIGGWVAALDDEEAARGHAASVRSELQWALSLIHEVERWQAAFVVVDSNSLARGCRALPSGLRQEGRV